MNKIRKAEEKDIPIILELLKQVNKIHYEQRPDIFKLGTKYTEISLKSIIADDNTPVFVSVDENDKVEGYVFCILEQKLNDNLFTDIKTLYIDDLCIDENIRGKHIGTDLYNFVLNYAKYIGCYNITLNVWSCNKSALGFYEHLGLIPQKIHMEKIL